MKKFRDVISTYMDRNFRYVQNSCSDTFNFRKGYGEQNYRILEIGEDFVIITPITTGTYSGTCVIPLINVVIEDD